METSVSQMSLHVIMLRILIHTFFFCLGQDIWLEEQERSQTTEVHQERYPASQIWTAKCQAGQEDVRVMFMRHSSSINFLPSAHILFDSSTY